VSNLENLLKVIKQVEATHRGIGVPLSFNILSVLAGQSVFNVASSGKCKTHMIYSTVDGCKVIPNMTINNWNAMTYYELVEKIGLQINKTLLWTVEEWSMLSDYHRELLMAIASKVQTDHNFERMVSVRGFATSISIQNCNLVLMIAIQPFKFGKLMRESDNWNSLANDRFIKMMLINPLQKDTKKYPPHFELPLLKFRELRQPAHPILLKMLTDHLTGGRAELSALNYMNAWCTLNDKDVFTDIDASAFSILYGPYLSLYPLMIYTSDPDREESFHTGPFRIVEYFMNHFDEQEITAQQLADSFHLAQSDDLVYLSSSSMYRHLNLLKHKKILTNNSPTWSLSPQYRDYFENYRKNWT